MSYFEEVEFEVSPDPNKPKVVKEVIDTEELAVAISKIRKEFENIKYGKSEHVTYAIDNGNFGSPVGNSLKTLEFGPTKKNMQGFIQIAKQELGERASRYFATLLAPTIKEVTENE